MNKLIVSLIGLSFFFAKDVCGEWALDAAPKFGNARTLSMGGVTIAAGFGADAFCGNPGGLARTDDIQIFVSSGLQLWGRTRYDDLLKPLYQLKNFGFMFPTHTFNDNISFVGAIGYRSFYDCDRKIENGYHTDKTTGLVDVLSMGVGVRFSTVGSFGLLLHIPVRTTYTFQSISYYGAYVDKRDVSSSMIVQLGGIIDLTPKWLIGFSCLLNHSYRFDYWEWGTNYSEKRSMPWTCDFGIAYRIKPDLLIAADIQNRPWERVRVNGQKIGGVKSGNAYRIGIESGSQPVVRAGYALDNLPRTDAEGESVDMNNLTVGLGYQWQFFMIDLGLSYQFDHIHKDDNIHELVFNFTVTCCL
ncbi:hypothetical protein MUP95_00210 [bacterium]|nr:hypothetical protein [bacterium]